MSPQKAEKLAKEHIKGLEESIMKAALYGYSKVGRGVVCMDCDHGSESAVYVPLTDAELSKFIPEQVKDICKTYKPDHELVLTVWVGKHFFYWHRAFYEISSTQH